MGDLIQLSRYRKIAEGRTPLFVNHVDGTIKSGAEFGDRIHLVRTSLEKINQLLAELKKQNREGSVYD